MKFKPLGSKLLILPLEPGNYKTEGNIEIIQNTVAIGEVIEVSEEYEGIIKVGDIVLYSDGAGITEPFCGKGWQWIDARTVAKGGDCWAIILDK